MAFQISPGVATSEVDLTTVVPSVQTTAGAFAGSFQWGPAEKVTQITNETELVSRFGKPSSLTSANVYTSFHTCASFLAYGNNLKVVRQIATLSNNSTANVTATVQIKNEDVFEETINAKDEMYECVCCFEEVKELKYSKSYNTFLCETCKKEFDDDDVDDWESKWDSKTFDKHEDVPF